MTRILAAASFLGVLLLTGAAAFAEDCLDRLEFNTYTCLYKSSIDSDETSSTLEFSNVNAGWSGFSSSLVPFVACRCGTDGTFKAPLFGHSKTQWSCLGAGSGELGTAALYIEGMVSANGKLTKVVARSFISDFGPVVDNTTYVLSCEKNED